MPTKRNPKTLPKLGTRLKQWRKSQGLTLVKVAGKIKGSPGPLSEAENGKGMPSIETVAKFHKKTNLNIMWLLFNEGEMLKGKK
jgi:transcriptional regulator with XRE-family HTH domain